MYRFHISALIFVITSSVFLLASGGEFKTKDGFTVYMPEGWIEIPAKVLQEYSESAANLIPQVEKQIFDYGFQYGNPDKWFSYPYILIQVNRSGRIPEGELKNYRLAETMMKEEIEVVQNKMAGIVSGARQGETIYDPSNHILWTTMTVEVENIGKIFSIIALKLTEFGFIQIMGYSKEAAGQEFLPAFKEIASNISLNPDIAYKRRLIEDTPIIGKINIGKVIRAAVIWAIIGGFAGLAAWFVKRGRRTSGG